MQNLYQKARTSLSPKRQSRDTAPILTNQSPLQPSLSPRLTLPPILHPAPYREIKIYATENGLILAPVVKDDVSRHAVCLSWGERTVVKEMDSLGADDVDAAEISAVTVLGLLGILDLFQCRTCSSLYLQHFVDGGSHYAPRPLFIRNHCQDRHGKP